MSFLRLCAGFVLLTCLESCSAECDCAFPGATFHVAPATKGHIVAMRFSGSACDGVTPECFDEVHLEAPEGQCSQIDIHPTRGGSCHVEVDFTDGTTSARDIEFWENDDCCAGVYVRMPPDGLEIKMPSAPEDAGTD